MFLWQQKNSVKYHKPPTMFEQSYWDADDEAIGQAYDALLVGPDTVGGEH